MDKFEIRRQNLQKILEEHCGNKIVNLADKLNKSHSYVSRMLYPQGKPNKKNIGDEMVEEIARAFNIPRTYIDTPVQLLGINPKSNIELAPTLKSELIPVISWVQAGEFCSVVDADVEKYVSTHLSHSKDTFGLKVKGVSMQNLGNEPSFNPGDIILCDPGRPATSGSLVVVRLDDENEATFKKLVIEDGRHYLTPLNPNWPEQIIEINGNATICGVVFQKIVEY